MNDEDIKLVKQIVKESVYEILETELYDALFALVDAIEAGVASFRQHLARNKGVEEKPERVWSWNPDKIKWEKAQGSKGEFEKSEDRDNPEFKSLLKDLAGHGGKLTRDGWFYWTYKNGSTVGRKRRGGQA